MKKIKDIKLSREGNDIVKHSTYRVEDFETETESEVVMSDVSDDDLLDVVDEKIRNFPRPDSWESKKEKTAWSVFFREMR